MVDTKSKKFLSKSQVGLYKQCPLKWKFIYKDKLQEPVGYARQRGLNIHSQIEHFYKNIELVQPKDNKIPNIIPKKDMKLITNFLNFEKERIKKCINKMGDYEEKYFKPAFQEVYIENETLGMRGVIDAVYINPKDDGVIIIDWKSGKYRPNKFNDYRFELAFYKEMLEASNKIQGKVKYWGIYFVDADKLFFENVKQIHVDNMLNVVREVKRGIKEEDFEPKDNEYCFYCHFQNICPLHKQDV